MAGERRDRGLHMFDRGGGHVQLASHLPHTLLHLAARLLPLLQGVSLHGHSLFPHYSIHFPTRIFLIFRSLFVTSLFCTLYSDPFFFAYDFLDLTIFVHNFLNFPIHVIFLFSCRRILKSHPVDTFF